MQNISKESLEQRLEASQLLSIRQVMALTTLSRASVYNMLPRGFPKPVKIGQRRKAWKKAEIVDWLESRSRCS